jgi:hypothetical protein
MHENGEVQTWYSHHHRLSPSNSHCGSISLIAQPDHVPASAKQFPQTQLSTLYLWVTTPESLWLYYKRC